MRQGHEFGADVRSSALWGKGGRGERRASALWGKGGRGLAMAAVASLSLALPLAAGARDRSGFSAKADSKPTYVAPGVYQAAEQNPNGTLALIVQYTGGSQGARKVFRLIEQEDRDLALAAEQAARDAESAAEQARDAASAAEDDARDAERAAERARDQAAEARERALEALQALARAEKQKKSPAKIRQAREAAERARLAAERAEERLQAAEAAAQDANEEALAAKVAAAEAAAKAAAAQRLAEEAQLEVEEAARNEHELDLISGVVAEVSSKAVKKLARIPGLTVTLDSIVKKAGYTSGQLWPHQAGFSRLWDGPQAPTIAIIDSGIEKGMLSFGDGSRIVQRQVFTSLQPNRDLDGRGHGTFVAGIAAGQAPGYAGASPNSKLVDLDVMNDEGRARTSDVIRACEWVLENKDGLNIRVVNLSLHSSGVLSIKHHPLNRAVEKLWFSGVTVVVAAGNYGRPDGPSGVVHSPGNDPFVITVGAVDLNGTPRPGRHDIPSWSAWGFTNEGFAKPDVVAAGRYMVGPVPVGATLELDKPANIVAPGYMRLSGTSFASPVVAGLAAQILARRPNFTPDQVKGAIMSTSRRIPEAARLEQGRGEINAVRAIGMSSPPNPNLALNRFVVLDPNGSTIPIFDASAWYDAMRGDSAWDSSAWTDSAWTDSAWLDSAWNDSAWLDSAWNDSAWNDSAWADSTSYEDNADGEPAGSDQPLTPEALAEIEDDPALDLPGAPPLSAGILPPVPEAPPPPPPPPLPPPPIPVPSTP